MIDFQKAPNPNLTGGHIYASYVIGSIGAGDDIAESIHYSGFVGQNSSNSTIRDCYSAVVLPDKSTGHDFCSNSEGTFTNCHCLNGSWTYNGKPYTELTGETIDGVTPASYTELQSFTPAAWHYDFKYIPWAGAAPRTVPYDIPAMQTVSGGYPFPAGTRHLAKDGNGNVIFNGADINGSKKPTYGAYYYHGTDWPKNWVATAKNSLLLLSNDAGPVAEPMLQSLPAEPRHKPEDESEP